jgi:hypothetical protein
VAVANPLTTREAARMLGVWPYTLMQQIVQNKLAPPRKDSGGRYQWLPKDVARARDVLAARRPNSRRGAAK